LGGVGGGHSPPPLIVISREARDLLFNRKGKQPPFELTPNNHNPSWGSIEGGGVYPLKFWRLLAKSARGNTPPGHLERSERSHLFFSIGY